MKKILFCSLLFLFSVNFIWADNNFIQLNLQESIKIALKNNPNFLQQKAVYESKKFVVNQQDAQYYPTISLNLADTGNKAIDSYNPVFTQNTNYNAYKLGLNLQQNIYDFGRREDSIKIAQINVATEGNNLENIRKAVVYNVKNTYYNVLQTQKLLKISLMVIESYQKHLFQAEEMFKAGKKPQYDVTKAKADLLKAKNESITALKNYKVAKAGFNQVLGLSPTTNYELVDELINNSEALINLDQALNKAYKNRSDLLSLKTKYENAQYNVFYNEKSFYPKLDGKIGYLFSGTSFPADQGLSGTISFNWDLFTGFYRSNKVDESKKLLDSINQQIAVLKLQINNDIEDTYYSLQEARAQIKTNEEQMKYAKETLDLADLRYISGLGNIIELTDATVNFNNASISYINALYNEKIAFANLENKMGL